MTSLWYDEVFVITHAQQGIIRSVTSLIQEDNALPLHGLLTALWVQVAGSSAFSTRYLSVLLGTLTTPVIIRLSGTLMRARYRGYGSGLAFATLPIFVYYTQEVRMYALAIPLATTYAWLTIRLYRQGKNAVLQTITGIAMLTAHIYTGLLWAVCLAWGMISIAVKNADKPLHNNQLAWLRAQASMFVLALPIAVWAVWRVQIDATATSAIPLDVIHSIPIVFGIGQYMAPLIASVFLIIICVSICVGCVNLFRTGNWDSALWVVLSLMLPIILLLLATLFKAKWSERYLLPSFGLGIVTGVGVGWETTFNSSSGQSRHFIRYRILQLFALCLVAFWLAGSLPAIKHQTTGTTAMLIQDEWHPRPDFRGVAQYIEAHDTPQDAIVVVAGYAAHTLDYYYDGPAILTGLPSDTVILNTNESIDLNTLQTLEEETLGREVVWLVLWQQRLIDPTNLIESMMVASCKRLPVMKTFTNISVLRFDVRSCRPLNQVMVPPLPRNVDFTAPIRFRGYDIRKGRDIWEVDLWWQSLGILNDNYIVFVHLVNPDGVIVAQQDHIAGSDAYPTSQWREGTYLLNRHFLEVPGGSCKSCVLHIGLYTNKHRLALDNGQDIIIIETGT